MGIFALYHVLYFFLFLSGWVCLYLVLSTFGLISLLLFCAVCKSAYHEDVKNSFDSMNTKECLFSTEKKSDGQLFL